MSTDANFTLGRRVTSCAKWAWKDGMRAIVQGEEETPVRAKRLTDIETESTFLEEGAVPDLSDPATKGCVLDVIRAAAGNDTVSLYCMLKPAGGAEWAVTFVADGRRFFLGEGSTPEYALVAALESTGSRGRR
jgi:hypothetical protein